MSTKLGHPRSDGTHAWRLVKTADKLHDFLMNPKSRPDLQTPEGQAFLNHLKENYHNEKTDPLMPWLTREWKKGRITSGPQGIRNPLGGGRMDPGQINHWADFYHSKDPERKGLGDIMQHDIHSFHNQVQGWDEGMKNREAMEAAHHGEVVHQYPDGWSLRQLHKPEELEAEGNNMGHCVGGYDRAVQDGRSLIYSLRDHKGMPHATMEIEPSKYERTDSLGTHRTDSRTFLNNEPIDRPIPHNGRLVQVQGKSNAEPLPEYKERIKQFMHTFPEHERPTHADGDYLSEPDDIERWHLDPNDEQNEYGLGVRPQVDWDSMVERLHRAGNRWNQFDYRDAENVYNLARAQKQIPDLAKATQEYDQNIAQPSAEQLRDMNLDYLEYPEDPNDEEAMERYYQNESELMEDHEPSNIVNALYGKLAPHYNQRTNQYENQIARQNTFS